jgi:serine/threonine-protein kinase
LAAGATLVAVAALFAAWSEPRGGASKEEKQKATSSLPATAVAPPSNDPRFTLLLDSVPPGAHVTEGDAGLGNTPLLLPIERTTVAKGARRFTLEMDGYLPYTVYQGDAHEAVRVVAPLVRAPAGLVTGPVDAGAGAARPREAPPPRLPTRPRADLPASVDAGGLEIDLVR